jgi:ribosomal protein L37AE/L43A
VKHLEKNRDLTLNQAITEFNSKQRDTSAETAISVAVQLPSPEAAFLTFGPDILNTVKVRQWLLNHLHQGRAACPTCGYKIEGRPAQSFWNGGRVVCRECRRFFSATTGTVLSRVKLSESCIYIILLGMALELNDKAISAMVGVTSSTVRDFREKLKLQKTVRIHVQI